MDVAVEDPAKEAPPSAKKNEESEGNPKKTTKRRRSETPKELQVKLTHCAESGENNAENGKSDNVNGESKPRKRRSKRSKSKSVEPAEGKSLREAVKEQEEKAKENSVTEESVEVSEENSKRVTRSQTAEEKNEIIVIEDVTIEEETRVVKTSEVEKEEDVVKENFVEETTHKIVTRSQTAEDKSINKSNEVDETEEMEPLVISDDHEPELQFESDQDDSPKTDRCTTRRSYSRNLPTPKTPKVLEQDSIDLDNLSTVAEAGSDVTRSFFNSTQEEITPHDDSYLQQLRNKSMNETLRPRRPIRDDYRKFAIRNRSDLNYSDVTDRISRGVKRKNLSLTPEDDSKKFKSDSPSFLSNIRSRFRSETSTPKLMRYRDSSSELGADEKLENGMADRRNWCNIM